MGLMNDQQQDEGYPPDEDGVDEDQQTPDLTGAAASFPQPRSAQVLRRVARGPQHKVRKPKSVNKGQGRIVAQQKRRQAIELRKAGATYQIIAEQVGYNDASAARKAVLKAYQQVIQEPVQELKTLQVERLNHMLLVLWPRVQAGDIQAMNTSLSIMNKIDALMGTEAAREVKVDNSGAVLVVDGNKDDFIKALQKMSGAGVMPDGTNMTAQQVQALPASGGPSSTNKAQTRYPPGMGGADEEQEDVVDAELVVEEIAEEALVLPQEPAQAVETKKKFSWSTDPKAKPRPKDQR